MKKVKLLFKYLFTKPDYIIKYTTFLIKRKFRPTTIIKTKWGFKMKLNLHNEIDAQIYLNNAFEEYLIDFYSKYLQEDSIFMDIGVNIGLYSLIGSRKISNGKIISFDPNPNMIRQVNESIKINKVKNIQVINKGLSAEKGKATFNFADDPAYSSLGSPHRHSTITQEEVELETIDNTIKTLQLEKVDFIKIDVEGAEKLVLEGAKKTIKKMKPTFSIEISDETYKSFGYTSTDVIHTLTDHGYKVYNYRNKKLKKEEIKDYYYYDNLIFIHKDNIKKFE